jgi:hypothetical protein
MPHAGADTKTLCAHRHRCGFFLFGFFITANALTLTDREIAVGLLAGFIGGLTMLIAVLWQERTARATMALVRTAAP